MDVFRYIEIKNRMTKMDSYTKACKIACCDCPLSAYNNEREVGCGYFERKYTKEAVEIVEKWAEENPLQTRQQKLLEVFPSARITENGIIDICPMTMNKRFVCQFSNCEECKKGFWLEEVED